LVEAAVRSGQPINLPSTPRRLVNGGQYNPPYVPLQITTYDELMGRHPYRTPAEERHAGQRSAFGHIYGTTVADIRPQPRSRTMRNIFESIYVTLAGLPPREDDLARIPQEYLSEPHDPQALVLDRDFTRENEDPLSYERQLAQSILAEEDREVFAALDRGEAMRAEDSMLPNRGIHAPRPFTQQDLDDLFRGSILPQPMTAPSPESWTVEELPGRMAINPAALRVMMPTFELASNPTMRLEDIRTRRFDILEESPAAITQTPEQERLWRQAFLGPNPFTEPPFESQNPCGEIPLAPREMTRAEMEEIALIVRRSSWERLLKDPDY
jgi:hypothetical protein